MSNANEPAFASAAEWHPLLEMQIGGSAGLTKREMFAMTAMQGYLCSVGVVGGPVPSDDDIARYSVDMADALLAALATPSEERKP